MSDIRQIQRLEQATLHQQQRENIKLGKQLFEQNRNNIHLRFEFLEKKMDTLYQLLTGKEDLMVNYPQGSFEDEIIRSISRRN